MEGKASEKGASLSTFNRRKGSSFFSPATLLPTATSQKRLCIASKSFRVD
jgi:hypothetical protein